MKLLAFEKELQPKTGFDEDLLKAEAKRVLELYEQGFIREIYFNKNNHSAVILLECEGENEAKYILNSLPLVKEGKIAFELIHLIPYDGFSRLLK